MNFPVDTFRELDTPFYAYDLSLLDRTIATIGRCLEKRPSFRVHYAVKANNNEVLLQRIAASGIFGADCVSGREVEWAVDCGIKPGNIVYSGVGKTDEEILLGLRMGIGCFNVESKQELEVIDAIAAKAGLTANVAIRINPDIDAHTHPNITTGTYEDQFGTPLVLAGELIERAVALERVNLRGLHFHIGSQLTDMEPFVRLVDKVNGLIDYWCGRNIEFEWINVGGGLGVDYDDPDANPVADFENYFSVFDKVTLAAGCQLHFELGRSVVAQCGSLVSRVLYIKESVAKKFAILDAGFTDLLRPALYGAHHRIDVLTQAGVKEETYDVVGPVCESTDCFEREITLPELKRGDLLAFRTAGAYGESMASTYNMRRLPASFYFNE